MFMTREKAVEATRAAIERKKQANALTGLSDVCMRFRMEINDTIVRESAKGQWQCTIPFYRLSDVTIRELMSRDPVLNQYTYNINIVRALLTISWRNGNE